MPARIVIFSILCVVVICVATLLVNVSGQTSTPNSVKSNAKSTQKITLPAQTVTTEKLVTTIRTNSSVSIGYYGLGQVACKSDETLTGGGYYSPQFREMLSVFRNGPSDNGKIWFVQMMYVGPHYYGTAPQFTTYGMCTKLVS